MNDKNEQLRGVPLFKMSEISRIKDLKSEVTRKNRRWRQFVFILVSLMNSEKQRLTDDLAEVKAMLDARKKKPIEYWLISLAGIAFVERNGNTRHFDNPPDISDLINRGVP